MIARIIAGNVPIILKNAQITFSTKLHGGFDQARIRCSLNHNLNGSRIETLYFQQLIITDRAGQVLFDGRVMSINIEKEYVEIEASGWGVSATMDELRNSTSTTLDNVSVIMAELFGASLCPALNTVQYITTNTTQAMRYTEHSEYPFEVASRLCALSDTTNGMWVFGVWENKSPFYYNVYDNQFSKNWSVKDNDDILMSYNTSAENLRNSVRAVYTDTNGAQATTTFSTDVQDGHPTRELEISITRSGNTTAANQARRKVRDQQKRPQSSLQLQIAGTINLKNGPKMPVEYVRAGDFIDISAIKSVAVNSTIDLKNVLVIGTSWSNGVLTITPGQ